MNVRPARGSFISIEGIEGVGKSTNINFICEILDDIGIKHISTREPGGTPIAEKIRDLLLAIDNKSICAMSEFLMIFAGRAQHIHELIEPALVEGTWVVCDRFTDATFAYQGGGRGLKTELISDLELITQKDLHPNKLLSPD